MVIQIWQNTAFYMICLLRKENPRWLFFFFLCVDGSNPLPLCSRNLTSLCYWKCPKQWNTRQRAFPIYISVQSTAYGIIHIVERIALSARMVLVVFYWLLRLSWSWAQGEKNYALSSYMLLWKKSKNSMKNKMKKKTNDYKNIIEVNKLCLEWLVASPPLSNCNRNPASS